METKRRDQSSSHRKHKKEKKHKKRRETRSSSSSSNSEGREMEWVEAPAPKVEAPKSKWEDWMNEENFVSTLTKQEMTFGTSSRERKKAIQLQKKEKEDEIKQSRELNPHWKNNGSGLPEEKKVASDDVRLPSTSVGDGGYSYLRKARLRLQEQAQEEGRTMEEVAKERWGSLSKLDSMIDEAEQRMKDLSKTRYSASKSDRDRHHKSPNPDRYRKPSRSSPSPERGIKYQKPGDYDRHRRKKCNVSSSRDHKRTYYSPPRHSDDEEGFSRIPKKDEFQEERRSFSKDFSSSSRQSGGEKRVPAWKKVKQDVEKVESSPEDRRPSASPTSEAIIMDSPPRERNESPTLPTAPVINSEDDLNRLAAKYLKAEMMGDMEEAARFKEELEEARALFKAGKSGGPTSSKREKERVMLTKMDSSGMQRPIQASREDAGFDRRSEKKQKKSTKFVEDASRYSLKQMFEREKLTTAEDNIEMFLDVAAQVKDGNDDEETSGISKKALQKMAHGFQEEKDIGKAIHQHQKMGAALEKCEYCLDQPNMKRHLIVSISEEVYLSIPNFQSLSEGHCLIVPKRHVRSFLNLDEDEWNEIEELRSLLRRFFRKQQKSLICLETSMNFGRCPHAIMECIPVPNEDGDMAPFYFKKAILESEEEWAHNVKLVDLTAKGLRRSVPKSLPYFCVSFDPAIHAGYAHVIEDEKCFPRNFGKEVLGGMLDIDYNFLYKNRKEDPVKKASEALTFTKSLDMFKKEK